MPNHWHLIVWPQQDGELSRFVGWVTLTHTQALALPAALAGQRPVRSGPLQDFSHGRPLSLALCARFSLQARGGCKPVRLLAPPRRPETDCCRRRDRGSRDPWHCVVPRRVNPCLRRRSWSEPVRTRSWWLTDHGYGLELSPPVSSRMANSLPRCENAIPFQPGRLCALDQLHGHDQRLGENQTWVGVILNQVSSLLDCRRDLMVDCRCGSEANR